MEFHHWILPLCLILLQGELWAQDVCEESGFSLLGLADGRRDISYQPNVDDIILCDYSRINEGNWYRFADGDRNMKFVLPEHCIDVWHCGTNAPVWLNGSHPEQNELMRGTACVSRHGAGGLCCEYELPVQIQRCNNTDGTHFFVYQLSRPPGCNVAFCTMNQDLLTPDEDSGSGTTSNPISPDQNTVDDDSTVTTDNRQGGPKDLSDSLDAESKHDTNVTIYIIFLALLAVALVFSFTFNIVTCCRNCRTRHTMTHSKSSPSRMITPCEGNAREKGKVNEVTDYEDIKGPYENPNYQRKVDPSYSHPYAVIDKSENALSHYEELPAEN